MFNFFNKSQAAFGLDVSSSSLHIMQLVGSPKQLSVKAFGQIQLPKGVVHQDDIIDSKLFADSLHQLIDHPQFGHVSSRYVVLSIPEAKSFVRVIQLPIMTETEAESAVPVESENFIPLPMDQVYLDWQLLGTDGDKMNVLIVASPREFIDRYLDAVESAGVTVAALEVESQSCHRALVDWGVVGSSALIVDLAATHTSLIVVEDGNLQFTSTVPIAGNNISDAIAKALGVSAVKAEAVKRSVGFANSTEYPNLKAALTPVLRSLTSELKNIVSFYEEHSGRTITSVVLTGGTARLTGLIEFIREELKGSAVKIVEPADPWRNVPGLKSRPLDQVESLDFTTSVGLALRGANFSE